MAKRLVVLKFLKKEWTWEGLCFDWTERPRDEIIEEYYEKYSSGEIDDLDLIQFGEYVPTEEEYAEFDEFKISGNNMLRAGTIDVLNLLSDPGSLPSIIIQQFRESSAEKTLDISRYPLHIAEYVTKQIGIS